MKETTPSPQKGSRHKDLRDFLILSALAILTALTFGKTLFAGFITLDDPTYVTQNPHVLGGLKLEGIRWALTATRGANWHPVTWISHMIDCSLFGNKACGHHATNLVLHILNTVLLFLALRLMTTSTWKSAFVAGLFGVHPLHVESVAWIAERKDVLSTLFWMLVICAYFQYAMKQSVKAKVGWYLGAFIFFGLGLMAKPMLVTLPFVLLLLDYWPLGRWTRTGSGRGVVGRHATRLVVEKVPFFLLSAFSSVITFVVQQRAGAVGPLEQMPLGIRVSNALVSYLAYIGKMLWPVRLIPFYPHPGESIRATFVLVSAIVLALVTLLAVRARRRRPYVLVGWLWYLGTLFPVIGIVQVGSQAMADRYTYVPLIGLFILGAWGIPDLVSLGRWCNDLSQSRRMPFLGFLGAVVILVLSMRSFVQASYWKDSFTLFGRTLQVSPANYVAHYNLGVALIHAGKLDEAYSRFSEALNLNADYADAYYNQGFILMSRGQFDKAIERYKRAIEIRRDFVEAHNNLAVSLFAKGDYAGAWHEVYQCRAYGFEPNPDFLRALSKKMPDPVGDAGAGN